MLYSVYSIHQSITQAIAGFYTISFVVAAAAAGQKAWHLFALILALIWVSPPWVQPHLPEEGGREKREGEGGRKGGGGREGGREGEGGEKWVEEDNR